MFGSIQLTRYERIRVFIAKICRSFSALIFAICCLVGCCWLCTLLLCHFGMPFKATAEYIGVIVFMEIISIYIFVSLLSALLARKAKKGGKSLLESVAGEPACSNWCWQGGHSFFTWFILWVVRKMRQVSALQLAKAFARRSAKKSNAPENIDVGSTRSNVFPFFQEFYVLLWCVFLSLQVFLGGAKFFVFVALDVYFIVESTTWILYYSVFRRFFEENYSVYHVMEHLPVILFMIPFQAIAYSLACMYGENGISEHWSILPVLLGQASEHYVIFSIMGFIYSAIVVSMIVSTFPVERVKASIPKTYIIGAGAVVKDRLLPALDDRIERLGKDRVGDISVYTKEAGELICEEHTDSEGRRRKVYVFHDVITEKPVKSKRVYELKSIYQLIKQGAKNAVAWIETPSDTHLYYLELLKGSAAFIVVEKPMVCSRNDLVAMREIVSSDYRSRIFFLSYYILEKALMLTFLRRPNSFYLRYFDEKVMGKFYQAYLELGKLKRITVEIIEGADQRHLPNGGQLVETFVHNCLIASLFAGLPDTWKGVSIKKSDDDANIELKAAGEFGEEIYLVLIKKGGYETRQFAKLEFEEGCIEADLYNRKASVRRVRGDIVELNVMEMYKERYAILCDMVYECYFNQIDPSRIDGLYHQVEVLEWFLTSPIFKSS